jgi:hypothetical protein
MGATRSPAVTGLPEQSFQLEHPSSEAIWSRAVEVFGNEDLALILGQSTPQQYSASSEPENQREILTILGRIDYGIFS